MRLVEFSVTNFRSITAASKISMDNLTVLVGKNNEGKSNLLTALNVAMNAMLAHSFNENDAMYRRLISKSYDWNRDFPMQFQSRKSGLESIFKMNFRLEPEELTEFHEQIKISGNDDIPITIKIGKTNRPEILGIVDKLPICLDG